MGIPILCLNSFKYMKLVVINGICIKIIFFYTLNKMNVHLTQSLFQILITYIKRIILND